MDITINVTDGVPIYRQIVNQVKYLVASGLPQPGKASAHPNARAAAEGDAKHDCEGVPRIGGLGRRHMRRGSARRSEGRPRLALLERRRIIEQRIDALLAEAHQLNFTADDILRMVRERKAAMDPGTTAEPADVER